MTPGLNLVSSNRVETLLAILAEEIMEKPLSSPFLPETVVVPNPAMARWVNLHLARHNGIAAHFNYPLPAAWIWEIARGLIDNLPDQDPLIPETTAWKIFFLLPDLLKRQEFHTVHHYLVDDPESIRRWQLSVKISDLFDRYQFYRPDLIRGWCKRHDAEWQSVLWRKLLETVQSRHRIDVIDELLEILSIENSAIQLPERISLFAISNLPPLFVDVLHALAAKTQINLFMHSPCEHYWADLSSKKAISRIRVRSPDKAGYHESGNELLASWGRQGQTLQDLLLNHGSLQSVSAERYEEPQPDCLLHQIQKNILNLESEGLALPHDSSIQIHICHSPLRECQVLHDQLLGILQADPSLRPEDLLVMIPEINRYAPYVEAVFGKTEIDSHPFIPWNLSDISVAEEHPLIEVFFQLLRLPDSRFTASEVLAFLDIPELVQRFNLDGGACEIIRDLIQSAKVRWGIDAPHKKALNLPGLEENTWRQAERRFFAGYSIGAQDYWNDIAPISEIEGTKALFIGRFWHLLQTLFDCREEMSTERSGAQWQHFLNAMLDRFFSEQADESGIIQRIRDALDQFQQVTSEEKLSRELVLLWLQKNLADKNVSGRYFSGGVNFCGMRPMRSLPFRVICLLGMNDQVFPRRDRPIEFDLMKQSWKPGDPNNGDEDRYLLLETLLCTRKILYISYTGRDLRDNSVRQPSVLIQELANFIDQFSEDGEANSTKTSARITFLHSMQPFSPKNFSSNTPAYDKRWARIAQALCNPRPRDGENHWPTIQIAPPTEDIRSIDLSRLHRFLKHPVKAFFTTRLKVRLKDHPSVEDSEPFAPNALERWQVKSMIAANFLRHCCLGAEQLRASGQLPHGSLGPVYLDQLNEEARQLLNQLEDYADLDPETLGIELFFQEDYSLVGRIANVYPGKGLLHFTPSKFKGTQLLALWLDHLCLSASGGYRHRSSRLICHDRSWRFAPLDAEQAREILWYYLQLYRNGMQCPLALFPNASHAWADYRMKEKPEQARAKAIQKWEGFPIRNILGEKDDPYIQLALRKVGKYPIDDPEFSRRAEEFYQDALKFAEPL